MDIGLDPLGSLWPPYRGAALLGAAQESQGRVRNAGIAITAGHVAISLDVLPARTTVTSTGGGNRSAGDSHQLPDEKPAPAPAPAAQTNVTASPPPVRLTVLLDAVPASAPKPGTQQLARFLTRVLGRSASEEGEHIGGRGCARPTRRDRVFLGADVPEMLVVEHTDTVVCSEFVRFGHRRRPRPGTSATAEGGHPDEGKGSSRGGSSSRLAYACIEASGLLRFWEWSGSDGGRWRWSFLNSCNICACREDPVGCRVLMAEIVPEPDRDSEGRGDSRRHRLVWEQEDGGEGAGLGLASTPATGPRPPRRVWSRRITFDLSEGGGSNGDGLGLTGQQQPEEHQAMHEDDVAEFDGEILGNGRSARSEISLAFSACLLPGEVSALLCSRLGAWMPTGARVYFNHFATGRLLCMALPGRFSDDRGGARGGVRGSFDGGDHGPGHGGESDVFTAKTGPGIEAGREDGDNVADADQTGVFPSESTVRGPANEVYSSAAARRLFALHESTGDLLLYDGHPDPTVRALSLPSGAGGLKLRTLCRLRPPPPPPTSPSYSPVSFATRSNLAVFFGGGVCSVYDLCTGRLVGTVAVPGCTAGAVRQPNRSLWVSDTRGHLVGVLTATRVLRVRLPRAEACLAATLSPSSRRGRVSAPSAPSILRCLREYRRLALGTKGGARSPADLLPELLQMLQQGRAGANPFGGADDGASAAAAVELIGHALAVEERGRSVAEMDANGGSRSGGGDGHKEAPIPPWLLMAMVSAARTQGAGGGAQEAAEMGWPSTPGAGDPAKAAPEAGLRSTLERRVAESLRSVQSVRALLEDPAGSARQAAADRAGRAIFSAAADEAAGKIEALTAAVDPATALFEGTLREWLACRRGAAEDGGLSSDGEWARESSSFGGRPPDVGLEREAGGSRVVSDDALAHAFRCEAVGDADAMEIPFLHFLLEESEEEDRRRTPDRVRAGGGRGGRGGTNREDKKSGGETHPASSSSSSTFLCLQLAGEDDSPLFEIACRALFRLQPRKLPRFVERLARFRAYADEIKEAARKGEGAAPPRDLSGEDNEGEEGEGQGEGEGDEEPSGATSRRGRQSTSMSSADARSDGTSAGDAASAEEQHQHRQQQQHRSPSPPSLQSGLSSRRASEDNASESGGGRAGRAATHPAGTSASTGEHNLPERAASPPPSLVLSAGPTSSSSGGVAADEPPPEPATGLPGQVAGRETPEGEETRKQQRASVAPAYFARALASLPPAAEDDKADGASGPGSGSRQRQQQQQRRARLSLLLGARMFTEASRLLRSRAWRGSGSGSGSGGWRGDRGAAEAWSAAVRLLNELGRAAAREEGENAAAAATAGGGIAAIASASTATAMSTASFTDSAAAGVPLSLQFRVAFEDLLAETILADSPERMEAVMLCRPESLTPVAVVRMVRRAAAAATAGGGGKEAEASKPSLSGSTQTLKMCLLMLMQDGGGQRTAAVT